MTRDGPTRARRVRVTLGHALCVAMFLANVFTFSAASIAELPDPPPLSPEESLAALHLTDEFVAEIVAAEPLVMDPVAIDWGADGKLWVAEMADYPLGMDGEGKPGGRIRYLEDTDDDGSYDRSTVFLKEIGFPNGVMAWKDGVLVTAAPHIFYAEDTDGDGKADKREVLYSGFVTANQQLRVNGLRYGLDNWIYCASGAHNPDFGKDRGIRCEKLGKVVPLGSRDFRIRPETGELEPISGPSQFGRVRDDWGNWFGVQNAHPLWHFALEDRYLRRNPHLVAPDARVEVIKGDAPRVYSAKTPQKRFRAQHLSNRFTSACGISIYRDELLYPRGKQQHSFTCEPFHNLVHHAVIERDGLTFKARRAEEEQTSEFFASRDRWCRPVMTRTGPDGALWVVDMYRYMIEHPQYLSDEGRNELRPHYRAGENRGRIYRVYRRGKPPREWPRIDRTDTQALVSTLSHSNGQVRDLAQRMLIERNDKAARPLLAAAVKKANTLGRLHALAVLKGINEVRESVLIAALDDDAPSVRRQAIRIAESRLQESESLRAGVLALANDSDAQVRQQLAFTLGSIGDDDATALVADMLVRESLDPYLTTSYLSSVNERNIATVLSRVQAAVPPSAEMHLHALERDLLRMAIAWKTEVRPKAFNRTFIGREVGEMTAADFLRIGTIFDAYDNRGASAMERLSWPYVGLLRQLRETALTVVVDDEQEITLRQAAVGMLLRDERQRADDIQAIAAVLTPQTPPEIQTAAIERAASEDNQQIAEILLTGWRGYGPAARREILRHTTVRRRWIATLLDAVERGAIPPSDLGPMVRQKVIALGDQQLRARARALLTANNDDRAAVLQQYASALELKPDLERGMAIFKNKCATCHRHGESGHEVGPNLAAITDISPRGLLVSILDPNRSVESRYLNYSATTSDGRTYSGILRAESGNSITLREAEAKEHVILRRDLEELQSSGMSLMPEGMEKELTLQDMADVIAYLARSRQD